MEDDPRHPDAPAAAAPFLDDYLLFLLAATSARMSSEFHAIVRDQGLRVREWRVLACLHDKDGQMTTRLAELALLEQSVLTRILDQMEAKGLVERRDDAADRRRVRVYLTAAGLDLAVTMIAQAKAHEADLLARLPGESGTELKALLRRSFAALEGDG